MLAIHPQARTTPAVGAQIASSFESSGVLARACYEPLMRLCVSEDELGTRRLPVRRQR